jgi:hypothetical protein
MGPGAACAADDSRATMTMSVFISSPCVYTNRAEYTDFGAVRTFVFGQNLMIFSAVRIR